MIQLFTGRCFEDSERYFRKDLLHFVKILVSNFLAAPLWMFNPFIPIVLVLQHLKIGAIKRNIGKKQILMLIIYKYHITINFKVLYKIKAEWNARCNVHKSWLESKNIQNRHFKTLDNFSATLCLKLPSKKKYSFYKVFFFQPVLLKLQMQTL